MSDNLTVIKKRKFSPSFFASWEMVLVYILVLINLMLMIFQPDIYFASGTMSSMISYSLISAIMVFGMIFILLLGDIDVSIASIMLLSAMFMGYTYGATHNAFLAILVSIGVGGACGFINGYLVSKFKMPAVIVTIATSMIFRGAARIKMGEDKINTYPSWFSNIGWNNFLGIPVSLWIFIAFAIIFGLILHTTSYGRKLYFIGNNPTASLYSGINTMWFKVSVFTIMGALAGVSAVFFIGRYTGIDYSMGKGLEMDIIAVCVLGGVSTAGGKGKIYGPVIATFVYGFLKYALELMNMEANTIKLVTGIVIIIAVIIPLIDKQFIDNCYKFFSCSNNKELASIRFQERDNLKIIDNEIFRIKEDKTAGEKEKSEKVNALKLKKDEIKKRSNERYAVVLETVKAAKAAKNKKIAAKK